MAEKTLSALSRELRQLYTKAQEALQRDNLDYAIDLLNQILSREPGVYECRRALRTAQARKSGGGSGFFKRMLHSAGSSPQLAKAQVALHRNAAEAIQLAEQVLNNDPNSSAAHRIIVEAARSLEMPQTARMSLEVLFTNSPRNKEIAIQFADSLAETGDPKMAETILGELYRMNPTDNDLAQALKNVSARTTLDEGGYEALANGSGSYRDILKNKEEAVSLEQQNRQVKTEDTADRLIREYEARLKDEPKNIKLLRDLGELYTQKKQFDTALGYYQQIKATDVGADVGLDKAIADTIARKYDHQIASLDPNSPDHPEDVARLEAEKQAYQLAECQKRVERFPTDLQLRFELGQMYLQHGKIGEAIQEFQKSKDNLQRRVASMNGLAQCFAKRKMYDLAARTLETAIKEKTGFDDEKKELVYNLGVVLQTMGKKQEAVEQFKLIYEIEIGYKDVAARVDAFYAEQSGT
jgi:tetratricopeptide (TPR) repeat protein